MYSLSVRFNSILFYTALILLACCVGNIITGYYVYDPKPEVSFKINTVHKFGLNALKKWDEAFFTFDLDANLTTLFNWNVKQLFLFLKVTFNEDIHRKYSENIVWDSIIPIQLKKKRIIKIKNERIKYPLRDVYKNLRNQTVKITLDAEIMPIVGYYYKKTIASFNYTFPSQYK